MNNENSSKQVLLSIIGIAILVVAVVGVSFAFFNYSKTGEDNNYVTTGSVFFNFTEGDAILLENQFPLDDDSGKELATTKEAKGSLSFSIVGFDSSAKGIDYDIYIEKGAVPTGETPKKSDGTAFTASDWLDSKDIKVYLVKDGENSATITNADAVNIYTAKGEAELGTGTTGGLKLAHGHIAGDTDGTEDSKQTDKFTLSMWIDSEVKITDDLEGDDAEPTPHVKNSQVYSNTEYADKFYAIKIFVDAKTAA